MAKKIIINGDNSSNSLSGTDAAEVIYGYSAHSQAAAIQATRIGSGFGLPLAITTAPGDPNHLVVVQRNGIVKVFDTATGQTLASPMMNLSSEIPTTGEQGMLGFAFDPDHDENGHVYVYMSTLSGDVEIRRYTVSADNSHVVDPTSKHVVKTIDYPDGSTKHRGGWIGFGPDGHLYVAVGDGENSANAQKLDNPLGKVLRLDVHGDDFPDDSNANYAIPSDNPSTVSGIAGDASGTGIFAAGLRNPWKGSFDRATGKFYISDVGSNKFEEINLIEAGANYGWGITEGPFNPDAYPDLTNPIYAYDRTVGTTIVGGYVYRGQEDAFYGQYLFADMNKGTVWAIDPTLQTPVATDITSAFSSVIGRGKNPIAFGEDAHGNLYMATLNGDLIRITLTPSVDQADVLDGGGGDDVIHAGAGDDQLLGGTGNDELHGMAGNDLIDGGSGRDRMIGGHGDDRYVVDNVGDVIVETALGGHDTVRTKVSYALRDSVSVEVLWTTNTSGTAAINLTGNKLGNQISGNAGANILSGLGGKDVIKGLGGNDVILGGSGNDDLHGDAGNDRVEGGNGSDTLEGGLDLDQLVGGAGADTFVWRSITETSMAADMVMDFNTAEGDLINLMSIDAREDRDGAQAFVFIGTAEFSRAGQLRYAVEGDKTLVYLNTDADADAEGVIALAGVHAVQADWFRL